MSPRLWWPPPSPATRGRTARARSAVCPHDPGTVGHHIRIALPADYYTDPSKRYPVLYLLDGSPGDPCDYFGSAGFPQFDALKNTSGMIIVMPDGGARGWYSNWRDQSTAAGAPNTTTRGSPLSVRCLIPRLHQAFDAAAAG